MKKVVLLFVLSCMFLMLIACINPNPIDDHRFDNVSNGNNRDVNNTGSSRIIQISTSNPGMTISQGNSITGSAYPRKVSPPAVNPSLGHPRPVAGKDNLTIQKRKLHSGPK